jgi:hypothetical protein
VLTALHEHAGARALAGAISGVFDGTMVVFLLCRPAAGSLDRGAVRQVEDATKAHRTVVRLLDGVPPGPLGGRRPAAAAAGADPHPGPAGRDAGPAAPAGRAGCRPRTATSTCSTRSPRWWTGRRCPAGCWYGCRTILPATSGGRPVDWQDMGRLVAQAVARSSGEPAPDDAERTSRLSDDTVVTLDLVRRPSPALVPSA